MKNIFHIVLAWLVGGLLVFAAFSSINSASAATMTDAEAKKQLALESQNLVAFGNPFGKTGKFEELYDPTGKPWWMVQLAKEAWSMETYGNPFGYPIAQRVIGSPAPTQPVSTVQSPTQPVIAAPTPVQSLVIPEIVQIPVIPEVVVEAPHFIGSPYIVATGKIAVRFSEPLTKDDPHQSIYRAYCTNGVEGSYIPTYRVDDGSSAIVTHNDNGTITSTLPASTIRGADVQGSGHYSCRFKFIDPVNVESEVIEFDL